MKLFDCTIIKLGDSSTNFYKRKGFEFLRREKKKKKTFYILEYLILL